MLLIEIIFFSFLKKMHGFYRGPVYVYNPRYGYACTSDRVCDRQRNIDRRECARDYRNCVDTGNGQCTREAIRCVRLADYKRANCARNSCGNITTLVSPAVGYYTSTYRYPVRYSRPHPRPGRGRGGRGRGRGRR